MRTLSLCFLLALLFVGCTTVNVDPGHETVLIDKPILIGHEGVRDEPVGPGLTYTWLSTSEATYNIQPAVVKESFDDLMTSDNNPVDFDVILTYQLQEGKTPILHNKFGPYWYENNIKAQFRNYVRDLAKQHKMFELASDSRISNIVEDSLLTLVSKFFASKELPVNVIGVSLGKVNPPQEVITETNKTAAQMQRIATEIQRVQAENARADAEQAKARADMSYVRTMGMSTDQYLQWLMIEVYSKAQNVSIITGGTTPVYNVR